MSRYWFSSANKECETFQAVSGLSYYMFIRQCTIPNYHRIRHSVQEHPFMLAVVPSFLRHQGSASASQAPDVSILSHLAPSSRVDLPDNHVLVPASKSAPCISECRCPIRVYRNGRPRATHRIAGCKMSVRHVHLTPRHLTIHDYEPHDVVHNTELRDRSLVCSLLTSFTSSIYSTRFPDFCLRLRECRSSGLRAFSDSNESG